MRSRDVKIYHIQLHISPRRCNACNQHLATTERMYQNIKPDVTSVRFSQQPDVFCFFCLNHQQQGILRQPWPSITNLVQETLQMVCLEHERRTPAPEISLLMPINKKKKIKSFLLISNLQLRYFIHHTIIHDCFSATWNEREIMNLASDIDLLKMVRSQYCIYVSVFLSKWWFSSVVASKMTLNKS